MDTNQNIQQAVMLVKQGDRDGALQIINRILEADPLNERAWLGFAYAVPNRQTGIQALEKVLEINPNNQAARRQLDLWLPQNPAPGAVNPAPAPGGVNPATATGFVYAPIPDPAPAPAQPDEPLPSWMTPTLATEETAPETGSVDGLFTGYQSVSPDPQPQTAAQNLHEDVYEAEKSEMLPGAPQDQLLQALIDSQNKMLDEHKKAFKYQVEFNNNLANVLNSHSRQLLEQHRQKANLLLAVLVTGGLVLVALIILLVK